MENLSMPKHGQLTTVKKVNIPSCETFQCHSPFPVMLIIKLTIFFLTPWKVKLTIMYWVRDEDSRSESSSLQNVFASVIMCSQSYFQISKKNGFYKPKIQTLWAYFSLNWSLS